jgi:hypothetical protein
MMKRTNAGIFVAGLVCVLMLLFMSIPAANAR